MGMHVPGESIVHVGLDGSQRTCGISQHITCLLCSLNFLFHLASLNVVVATGI